MLLWCLRALIAVLFIGIAALLIGLAATLYQHEGLLAALVVVPFALIYLCLAYGAWWFMKDMGDV